ncbi:Transcription initiation factor IIF, beta subunit [Trifolium repens]|nr:Transcription initiation factor IIF, beta subunit [Trifolium repens]
MELGGNEGGNASRSFAMDMSKDFIPMTVFSDSTQGKVSVEGKIVNKFDMRPHNQNLELYGKLCRERTKKYTVKNRQIRVIEHDTGANMRPMPGMVSFSVAGPVKFMCCNIRKRRKLLGEEQKLREQEEIIFKLFERQPNWSLRNLIQETDQPEQFLKDILKDLCVYNNKGTNQGTYELKPEYRKAGD